MSRYAVTAHDPFHQVTVGWDNPLATFFAQVCDPEKEDEDKDGYWLLYLGTALEDVVTVEALQAHLAPFATLSEDVVAQLRADQRQASPGRSFPESRLVWFIDCPD